VWAAVAAGWLLLRERGGASDVERKSIAVLPFENLSPDPDDAYFTDGIHEEIITQLHKIAAFDVISRTSVLAYRDTDQNLRQIGSELGVTTVLEGSVRRAGERVRISAQLIDAETDRPLWADVYETGLTDIFTIQADIAQQIAEALRVELSPDEESRLTALPTQNADAYDHYLLGRSLGLEVSIAPFPDVPLRAEEAYKRATQLDPDFALAWAALSRIQNILFFRYRQHDRRGESKASLDRAVAIAPDVFETHVAQAHYYKNLERDYDRAAKHYDIARTLRPGSAESHAAGSSLLIFQGQWQEAADRRERALQLDPLNEDRAVSLGLMYRRMRRYAEAERHLRRAIALAPDRESSYNALFNTYLRMGDTAQAWQFADAAPMTILSETPSGWRVVQHLYRRDFSRAIDQYLGHRRDFSRYFSVAFWARRAGQTELQQTYADSLRAWAEAQLESEFEIENNETGIAWASWQAGLGYALLGEVEEARSRAAQALDLLPISEDALNGVWVNNWAALIHQLTGDHDTAIDLLEISLSLPAGASVETLRIHPRFDDLRDHPRFQALLEKLE
jgi:serine/threonine-protein kinase